MATLPEHLHTRHCARYLTHTTQVLTIEDREAGLLAPSDKGGAQGADRSAKYLRVTQLVRVEQDLGPGRQAPHPALSTIALSHLPPKSNVEAHELERQKPRYRQGKALPKGHTANVCGIRTQTSDQGLSPRVGRGGRGWGGRNRSS